MALTGKQHPFNRWYLGEVELSKEIGIAPRIPGRIDSARPINFRGKIRQTADPTAPGLGCGKSCIAKVIDAFMGLAQQKVEHVAKTRFLGCLNQLLLERRSDHSTLRANHCV